MTAIHQTARILEEGRALLDTQGHPGTLQRLIVPAYRLLAAGQPASPADIAEAAGLPLAEVEIALRDFGDVERTVDGRVEGLGLTRRETPHRVRVGEQQLYTWCAMDSMIAAAVLDQPIRIESPDSTTGQRLVIEAAERRIQAADPPSIVVSWYVDPSGKGVRSAGCQFGQFFASAETAASWLARFPRGGVLSLQEALDTARRFVSETFGASE
jgi:alkylmercury lyase